MVASYYAWDPEFDCITEETSAAGAITARYTQEPRPYGGLVSQRRASTTSYYHYDNVGTTRVLTNQAQSTTLQTTYTAFGENVNSTGSTVNPFGFVGFRGFYNATASNAIFTIHQFLNSELARWCSLDPAHTFRGTSSYAYAANRPTLSLKMSGDYKIIVIPIEQNLKAKCGEKAYIWWDFVIEGGAPEKGYIVQKVAISCAIADCPKLWGECKLPSPKQVEYWEAWPIEAGAEKVNGRNIGDRPPHFTHTDGSEQPMHDGKCGYVVATGDVRFYSEKDTKYLGTYHIEGETNRGIWGNQYIHFKGTSCQGGAGDLPAYEGPPNPPFWKDEGVGVGQTASRAAIWTWNCCKGVKKCGHLVAPKLGDVKKQHGGVIRNN